MRPSLHFYTSDPAADVVNDQFHGQPGYDGLFCLKPLLDDILMACRAHYHPHQNLAVDEHMVTTKARIRMKQYVKDKPTKWRDKLFVLANIQSGYTCDFSIYERKARSPSGNGLSFDAVVSLLKMPYLEVDNFYASKMLFNRLYQLRVGGCGTMWDFQVQWRMRWPRKLLEA